MIVVAALLAATATARRHVREQVRRIVGTSPGGSGEPTFIITGGAGAPLSGCDKGGTGKPGAYYHYLVVTVHREMVTVTPQPLYGTTPCTAPPAG
jgi:hypothetical protein